MMWSLAVWLEKNEEIEMIISSNWIMYWNVYSIKLNWKSNDLMASFGSKAPSWWQINTLSELVKVSSRDIKAPVRYNMNNNRLKLK